MNILSLIVYEHENQNFYSNEVLFFHEIPNLKNSQINDLVFEFEKSDYLLLYKYL